MNRPLHTKLAGVSTRRTSQAVLIGLAVVVLLYTAWLALRFAGQPPLEWHGFRQTQTALSAYWLGQDGFRFAYETPVAGRPWSIPFEFPLYPWLVAMVSKITGISLDSAGRVTSFVFLALSLWPVRSTIRRLDLPSATFWCFVAITFSSPLYAFWGRSFMIETTALFFTLASIRYFIDILLGEAAWKPMLLFFLFASLAVLQKSTTALPALMVLSVVFCIHRLSQIRSIPAFLSEARTWKSGLCVMASVLVGYAWVYFSDAHKALNPLGKHMTAYMIYPFTLGTTAQRFSPELWEIVVWQRMFVNNAGSILGAFLLTIPFVLPTSLKIKSIIATSIAISLLPLLLFTNLHITHDYYQVANMMFLSFAIAVAIATTVDSTLGHRAVLLSVALIVASNIVILRGDFQLKISKRFDKSDRDVAIGALLQRELKEDRQFVAFGHEWNSSFAYLSKRKSFTVPDWLPTHDAIAARPEDYVDKGRLGAVVACSTDVPSLPDLMAWSSQRGRDWKIGESQGCLIATPKSGAPPQSMKQIECNGNIEKAKVEERNGQAILSLDGWALDKSSGGELPGPLFFALTADGRDPVYLEALRVPRVDVTTTNRIAGTIDPGISRIAPMTLAPGEYTVRIVARGPDGDRVCQLSTLLTIPD